MQNVFNTQGRAVFTSEGATACSVFSDLCVCVVFVTEKLLFCLENVGLNLMNTNTISDKEALGLISLW